MQTKPAVSAIVVVNGDREVRRRRALHPPELDVDAAALRAWFGDLQKEFEFEKEFDTPPAKLT